MPPRLPRLLAQAMALLATGGCRDEPIQSDSGQYRSDDGLCSPEHLDSLARLDIDSESRVLRGHQPTDGEIVLACLHDALTEDQCLAEPGSRDADATHIHVGFSSIAEVAARREWGVESGDYDASAVCGPAWVDGACCYAVRMARPPDEAGEGSGGRPFLVRDRRRQADIGSRATGWTAPIEAAGPPAADRPLLARHWTRAGQAEHASIAAFSRFALVLMHHGAPPDLLRRTHAAALDEVRHAAQCFALASAYAGDTVGPGPLDVTDALHGDLDPARAVRTLVIEGCIGETLAALEAAEAARRCADPVVRGVLDGIATDEARHAALSWDALRWFVSRDPALRAAARAALATVEPVSAHGPAHLEPAGQLSPATRSRVHRIGRSVVIDALAAAVLEVAPSRTHTAEGAPA